MTCEFDAIFTMYDFKYIKDYAYLNLNGNEIYLIKCGIGKVNSALKADYAIRLGADVIISTGLAGGIDSCLKQGDVVLASKVCYHDVWCGSPNLKGQVQNFPLYYTLDESLARKLHSLVENNSYKYGLTLTGDQFLTDVDCLNKIKTEFPEALAVDMESASIAQTCYLNNTPFISLRIISDVVGVDNQEEQYESLWKNLPNISLKMVDEVLNSLKN
jgi:adenosylhomocysteine nucleosidase